MGMGSGGIYAGIYGSSLHRFPDPLAGDVQHGAVSVLGVEGSQVGQALQEIRRDRDLAALACLVPWDLGPDADDRRLLVEPEVASAKGQASETLSPVLSMILKAMRVGYEGAASTRASASSGVK